MNEGRMKIQYCDDIHPGCEIGAEVVPAVLSSVHVGLLFEVWGEGEAYFWYG